MAERKAKLKVWIVMTALVALFIGAVANPPHATWQSGDFSFSYPMGWDVTEDTEFRVTKLTPVGYPKGCAFYLGIGLNDLSRYPSAEDAMWALLQTRSFFKGDYRVKNIFAYREDGGAQMYYVDLETDLPDRFAAMECYFWGNRAMAIVFAATGDGYKAVERDFWDELSNGVIANPSEPQFNPNAPSIIPEPEPLHTEVLEQALEQAERDAQELAPSRPLDTYLEYAERYAALLDDPRATQEKIDDAAEHLGSLRKRAQESMAETYKYQECPEYQAGRYTTDSKKDEKDCVYLRPGLYLFKADEGKRAYVSYQGIGRGESFEVGPFTTQCYVMLRKDLLTVTVKNATFRLAEGYEHTLETSVSDGMYLAGLDIPAGWYQFYGNDGELQWMVCSYADPIKIEYFDYKSYDFPTRMLLSDGEFLTLKNGRARYLGSTMP